MPLNLRAARVRPYAASKIYAVASNCCKQNKRTFMADLGRDSQHLPLPSATPNSSPRLRPSNAIFYFHRAPRQYLLHTKRSRGQSVNDKKGGGRASFRRQQNKSSIRAKVSLATRQAMKPLIQVAEQRTYTLGYAQSASGMDLWQQLCGRPWGTLYDTCREGKDQQQLSQYSPTPPSLFITTCTSAIPNTSYYGSEAEVYGFRATRMKQRRQLKGLLEERKERYDLRRNDNKRTQGQIMIVAGADAGDTYLAHDCGHTRSNAIISTIICPYLRRYSYMPIEAKSIPSCGADAEAGARQGLIQT
ncbi:uncharacterized protein K460DRAFT_390754 [Cucurbitaria berberidis CBS 394.84]|uniref:Uncharacterized protein n=1 Tax=Cucurbitaria berberidis CBS 394.84 TaxID=1168544 RepID=A0A9P4LDB1_9PLEO|nr:uncharacterized protein K460DRAFT_390754 [Cucurbitaria berberidis CBS 394.84]KAF1850207.1 hypothetical protein K460DRAFT_390754 [Cucurbitaria berberidis CBS 394.84]